MVPLFLSSTQTTVLRRAVFFTLFLLLCVGFSSFHQDKASAASYNPQSDYMDEIVPKWLQYRALIACYDAAPGETQAVPVIAGGDAKYWYDKFDKEGLSSVYVTAAQRTDLESGNQEVVNKALDNTLIPLLDSAEILLGQKYMAVSYTHL